jgi:hypothetical protein
MIAAQHAKGEISALRKAQVFSTVSNHSTQLVEKDTHNVPYAPCYS